VPAHERSAILMRVADAIEADEAELSRLLATENGRTHRETSSEMKAAVRIWRG
jgi:acyl-CoA reductase-like NAD-dependent aldehyde dehydrogenase